MSLSTRKVKVVDVQDWDNLVQKTYGRTYLFQQQDGCKSRQRVRITIPVENPFDYPNDTIPEVINGEAMGVSFKAWLERDPKAPLNCTKQEAKDSRYYWGSSEEDLKEWQEDESHISMFYERNFYPHVDMIINDLYSKGLLPKGELEIDIDW